MWALIVKMSYSARVSSGETSWRKTVSERLNSAAMACFWASVRATFKDRGTLTTARGFPCRGVVVKTSRMEYESFILRFDDDVASTSQDV